MIAGAMIAEWGAITEGTLPACPLVSPIWLSHVFFSPDGGSTFSRLHCGGDMVAICQNRWRSRPAESTKKSLFFG
jgi:hypothetical protein